MEHWFLMLKSFSSVGSKCNLNDHLQLNVNNNALYWQFVQLYAWL